MGKDHKTDKVDSGKDKMFKPGDTVKGLWSQSAHRLRCEQVNRELDSGRSKPGQLATLTASQCDGITKSDCREKEEVSDPPQGTPEEAIS